MQTPKYASVLKRLMHAKSIKPTELARQTGIEQSTISRLVNGRIKAPAYDKLEKLASYFGVSVDQLLGEKPISGDAIGRLMFAEADPGLDVFGYDNESIFRESSVHDTGDEPKTGFSSKTSSVDDASSNVETLEPYSALDTGHLELSVPFYDEVELAAGFGSSTTVDVSEARITVPRYAIEEARVKPSDVACAKVRGDSMYPVISDGAIIGIDTSDTRVQDHEIYAFEMDGMLRVKYLYRLPFNRIRIASQDSDLFPDEIISSEDLPHLRVIGRVFYWPSVRPRRR